MFLSEPLQRQYGRRQIIGRMTKPTPVRVEDLRLCSSKRHLKRWRTITASY
jgi:hypothetical protein